MHIVGHHDQRTALHRLFETGRLPSTMMLAGQSGIGKRRVALELAQCLVCQSSSEGDAQGSFSGCGQCKSCKLFGSGNHPDFYFIQCKDREAASVSAIRELLFSLNLTPFASARRAVIFDNAEYLSAQSSNALLKALEEPRPGTFYLLVTANPSRLPATLLSRCQIWFFDALEPAQVQEVLEAGQDREFKEVLATVPAAELAVLADGSLEGLQSVAMHLESWSMLKRRLDQVAYGNISEAVALASDLSKDKEKLRGQIQLLRIRAREKMLEQCDQEALCRWAVFLANIVEAERLIFERNLAPLTVLAVALLGVCNNRELPQLHQFARSVSLLSDISV